MADQAEESAKREWVELGARLRHAREYLSLSQQDVAANTGIPRSAISDIERGQRKVDSLELRKLAKVYRRPVSSLLGDEVTEAAAAGGGEDGGANEGASDSVVALARAVQGLTEQDKAEVVRFAEFLRFQAGGRSGGGADGVR
jgi:transcriptional regulator with XRE-family HTH domain